MDQTRDLRGARRLLEQFCNQSFYLMQPYLFTGIKETMVKMLLSYNSLWLRIGLEVNSGPNCLRLSCCAHETHGNFKSTFFRQSMARFYHYSQTTTPLVWNDSWKNAFWPILTLLKNTVMQQWLKRIALVNLRRRLKKKYIDLYLKTWFWLDCFFVQVITKHLRSSL